MTIKTDNPSFDFEPQYLDTKNGPRQIKFYVVTPLNFAGRTWASGKLSEYPTWGTGYLMNVKQARYMFAVMNSEKFSVKGKPPRSHNSHKGKPQAKKA